MKVHLQGIIRIELNHISVSSTSLRGLREQHQSFVGVGSRGSIGDQWCRRLSGGVKTNEIPFHGC